MSPESPAFTVSLERLSGYEFKVRFDGLAAPDLLLDEPEPLGHASGPNASRILAAAVANCLSASLLFCLSRSRIDAGGLHATVSGYTGRNEQGRLRVERFEVNLGLGIAVSDVAPLRRCLELFEDYCVVTESVRQGIPVAVQVTDAHGNVLHTH